MACRQTWQSFAGQMASTIFDEGRILPDFGAYNQYWLARTYNWSLLGLSKAPAFRTELIDTGTVVSWLPSGFGQRHRAYGAQLTAGDCQRPIFVLSDAPDSQVILDGVHRVHAANAHGLSNMTVVRVSRKEIIEHAVIPEHRNRNHSLTGVLGATQPPYEPVSPALRDVRAMGNLGDGRCAHPDAISMLYCATSQVVGSRLERRQARKAGRDPVAFAVEIARGSLGLLQPPLPFRPKPNGQPPTPDHRMIADFTSRRRSAGGRSSDSLREALLLAFLLKLARHIAASANPPCPEERIAGFLSSHPCYRELARAFPEFRGERLRLELEFAREIEKLLPWIFRTPMSLRTLRMAEATHEGEVSTLRLLHATLLALRRAKEWRSAKFDLVRYNANGHLKRGRLPDTPHGRRQRFEKLAFGTVGPSQISWPELLMLATLSRVNPGLLWHELRWAVPAFDMMIACGDLLRIGQTFIPVWVAEGYLQHRSLDGAPSGNPFSFLWTMVDAALHRATPFADQVDSHLATICLRGLAADRTMLVTLTPDHRLVASAASESCDNWLTLGLLA